MWIKRILASLTGVRTSKDLEDDLNNITVSKFIILVFTLNLVFVGFIILVINLI